jgi:hypothetical protein
MLFARYWLAIPTLAIAGSLARKKVVPAGPGTLPTHTPLFVALLIGVVVLVRALTFIPALAGTDRGAPHDNVRQVKAADMPGVREVAPLFERSSSGLWSIRSELTPRFRSTNPVMFVVYVGSILTSGVVNRALIGRGSAGNLLGERVALVHGSVANFAEAMAEGRGRPRPDALRRTRRDVRRRSS